MQLISLLLTLKQNHYIHRDLKPENILLKTIIYKEVDDNNNITEKSKY